MSDSFLVDMRDKLLDLQADLEGQRAVGDQSAQVVELDQSRVGRLSRMDALQGQAMAQAAGRRREMMLQKIAMALARIDKGEYGLCQSCEEPINGKRLEFDPAATLCIQCAELAEQ